MHRVGVYLSFQGPVFKTRTSKQTFKKIKIIPQDWQKKAPLNASVRNDIVSSQTVSGLMSSELQSNSSSFGLGHVAAPFFTHRKENDNI